VKPSVTTDFLRGILFAYVAYNCYVFAYTLWIGLSPRVQPLQAGGSALALTIFIILGLALLFRPVRSARTVFIFISLLCLLWGGAALFWLSYPANAFSFPRPMPAQLYRQLLSSLVVAGIAYFHYRGCIIRPNQFAGADA